MDRGDAEKPIVRMARLVTEGDLISDARSRLDADRMSPILHDQVVPGVKTKVERYYFSVAAIFEMWVTRR